MSLLLYNFFHLNLSYSAIEEEERSRVIEKCYWPLLNLANDLKIPIGVELSGYTLEEIQKRDYEWINLFKKLLSEGTCELIGSGYSQIIGPLVPYQVNEKNLEIGNQVYESLLDIKPNIVLVNEQAYAASLVPLYINAGYKALIMEWNNPYSNHQEWNPQWRYYPQKAISPSGQSISLIWNKSITFQKFQRYVHGEIELEEFLEYIASHISNSKRALSLYGNDVEIFDFRPGRYMTEASLSEESEWKKIKQLYSELKKDNRMEFISPSKVLDLSGSPLANHSLHLESANQPIPVKKQDKYNILRWGVTGRDDLAINTRCWKIFKSLQANLQNSGVSEWKEICYLWSSDFRTHITDKRWRKYLQRLSDFEKAVHSSLDNSLKQASDNMNCLNQKALGENPFIIERKGRILEVSGKRLCIRFNCSRGLAVDRFIDRHVSDKALWGTLSHGYFDDIHWGADYYSGHLTFESPGVHKVTDLCAIIPEINFLDNELQVSCDVDTSLGLIKKKWLINDDTGLLSLSYSINWIKPVIGSLRLGHVTLIPELFDRDALFFKTNNGGNELETFDISKNEIDHGRSISFLISASQAVGLTKGKISIGDNKFGINMSFDNSESAMLGMITHQLVDGNHFTRLLFSLREIDDTSRPVFIDSMNVKINYNIF